MKWSDETRCQQTIIIVSKVVECRRSEDKRPCPPFTIFSVFCTFSP